MANLRTVLALIMMAFLVNACHDGGGKKKAAPVEEDDGFDSDLEAPSVDTGDDFDTDTDDDVFDMVIEEFILRDRKRAEVYNPNQGSNYGYYDY